MAKRNATKLAFFGGLLGAMKFKLEEHEEQRRMHAEEVKQRRLQQIQIEAEQRQNAEWERRNAIEEKQYEKRDARDHEQAIELDDRRATREEARDERTWQRQEHLARMGYAHADASREDQQRHSTTHAALTHQQALERIEAQHSNQNESGQPISFMAVGPNGEQQYVTLQPGQQLGRGWKMLTTSQARSPMPSETKGGGYVSPRGGANQALLPQGPQKKSWEGWGGVEIK